MFGLRLSTIFRSRWLALLFAGGVVYLAMQVAAPDPQEGATDVTGATITDADARNFAEAVNGL